ncbi:hypothetical protein [Vibrio sp. WXL210]|uniref:hypothetical protein n=1 Tax=Vibrio sp. WXL210 TaxID=3450709 RepID=UPI003EC7944D
MHLHKIKEPRVALWITELTCQAKTVGFDFELVLWDAQAPPKGFSSEPDQQMLFEHMSLQESLPLEQHMVFSVLVVSSGWGPAELLDLAKLREGQMVSCHQFFGAEAHAVYHTAIAEAKDELVTLTLGLLKTEPHPSCLPETPAQLSSEQKRDSYQVSLPLTAFEQLYLSGLWQLGQCGGELEGGGAWGLLPAELVPLLPRSAPLSFNQLCQWLTDNTEPAKSSR